jgi:cell division protein FtsX
LTPIAPRIGGVALFWVIAIACFLAVTAGLAARLADRTANSWNDALRGGLTARILAPEGAEGLNQAALQMNGIDGVRTVRIVTAERAAQLLRHWGGPEIRAEDLPALRLLEFSATRAPTTNWLATVQSAMRAAGFQTEIYGPGPAVRDAAENATFLAKAAIAIGAMLAGAGLLTAGLAGRARAAIDRELIAPLADMGATRGQVSGAFAVRSAVEGFAAGLVGAFAAIALGFWLLSLTTPDLPFAEWGQRLDPTDGAPILAAPVLAALLAAAGARAACNRLYEQAARHA